MSFTLINQRGRDCNSIRTFNLTTPTPVRGLAWDGSFLWASGNGDLQQFDVSTGALLKTVATTGGETYDDLTFDGEYFWGPVSGNVGIGQITREGQRINFIGSIFSASPIGIAHDGHFLWALYVNAGSGFYDISQFDPQWLGISRTFSTGLATVAGLIFDGEYLVTRGVVVVSQTFYYFTREGQLVKTATEGSATGGTAFNGLAFDGEYFYQGLSV